jgi:putative flippase GtrA
VRGTGPATRYCGVQALGAGANAVAVWALVGGEHAPRIAGELVAVPFASLMTFALCRRWVFGAGPEPAA